jgi:hormone-sensitive lipase
LGIDPKQVVLVGDSAGGHLCAAVTILSILRGVQVPSGLILHYPALMTDLNRFYPSTLIALDDPILNQSFLKFCLKSFLKNGGNASLNPLISPVVCPDSILKKFPTTRIIACEADPLRDPSYEFALRLKKLGVDSKLYIMKDYIHGFNNFDMKFGIQEYHNGTILTE